MPADGDARAASADPPPPTAVRRSGLVVPVAAWAALGIGCVAAAFSLPIDDFWLTLASGREIAAGADPARAIPLTWLPTLPDALNPQWGAQVLLGAPGWLGWALALNTALIAGGLLLTALRAADRGRQDARGLARTVVPAGVAIAMFAALAVLAPHLLARAQSFSIALFPLALLLLERWTSRWWLPIAYGALMAAWANLHGAFVIGQLAAVVWLAGAVVDAAWQRRGERRRGERPGGEWRRLAVVGATAGVALAAPLLNPAGAQLLAYAYGQGTSDVVRAISVEWQPAWPWIPIASLHWLLVAAVLAGRLLRQRSLSTADLLLGAALAVLAATGIRHIPWFALWAAPILAADLAAAFAARPRLARAVGGVGAVLSGRPALVLAAATSIAILLQPIRPALPPSVARLTPDAPVRVADRLARELPAGANEEILNEQVWGGYLEWRLDDRIEPAMDGRLEIRSREAWVDYFALMRGEGEPAAELDQAGVRWAALMHRREALIGALEEAGWEVMLEADEGVLLARP